MADRERIQRPERSKQRKQLKRYHAPGDFHGLTFSCYQQLPLLINDDWCCRLSHHLTAACRDHEIDLNGFVYMPTHVHLVIFPRQTEPDIGRFLAAFKQPFSKEIKQILIDNQSPLLEKLTVRERPGKTAFRFWQEGGGHDKNISLRRTLSHYLDYVHLNPAAAHLCERAIDWRWSSARYYLLNPPKQQFDGLPYLHGLPYGFEDLQ